MNYTKSRTIVSIISIFLLAGCSKNNHNPGQNIAGPSNIYVAGQIVFPNNAGNLAIYWKNDTPYILSYTYSSAMGIFTSGSDVYIAGFTTNPVAVPFINTAPGSVNGTINNSIAVCWKNGVPIYLSDSNSVSAGANAVYVTGGDVYVAGYYISDTQHILNVQNSIAAYWKNGNLVSLSNGIGYVFSQVTSIFVSGSDVYAAGYAENGNTKTAIYWKNGAPVVLSEGNIGTATSIVVSGSTVYVAGYLLDTTSNNYEAGYWVNGVFKPCTNGTGEGYATSIGLIGSSVLVGGYETNGTTNTVAEYWKDQSVVPYNVANNDLHGQVNALAIYGSHMYAAGTEYSGFYNIAVYWADGILNNLTNANNTNAYATAIAVGN